MLTAKELMSTNVITVTIETPVRELAKVFSENAISGAPVVDDQSEVIGVVTESDLIYQHKKVHSPTAVAILDAFLFVENKTLLILVIAAILVQGFINFPSGYLYNGDLLFWSSQGHDGLWHVALMEEMRKTLPLQNPLIANKQLYN